MSSSPQFRFEAAVDFATRLAKSRLDQEANPELKSVGEMEAGSW
jgi:hypothetical protein